MGSEAQDARHDDLVDKAKEAVFKAEQNVAALQTQLNEAQRLLKEKQDSLNDLKFNRANE